MYVVMSWYKWMAWWMILVLNSILDRNADCWICGLVVNLVLDLVQMRPLLVQNGRTQSICCFEFLRDKSICLFANKLTSLCVYVSRQQWNTAATGEKPHLCVIISPKMTTNWLGVGNNFGSYAWSYAWFGGTYKETTQDTISLSVYYLYPLWLGNVQYLSIVLTLWWTYLLACAEPFFWASAQFSSCKKVFAYLCLHVWGTSGPSFEVESLCFSFWRVWAQIQIALKIFLHMKLRDAFHVASKLFCYATSFSHLTLQFFDAFPLEVTRSH